MSAYDDETTPWLPAVRDYVRDCVETEVATLGICLGAQLLAVALGGEVERSAPTGPERGIVELRMRSDAADDALLGPLVAELGRDVLVPSSHDDAASTLPENAIRLASFAAVPVPGVPGRLGLGLQFHPEAGEDRLAAWTRHDGGDDAAVEQVRARPPGCRRSSSLASPSSSANGSSNWPARGSPAESRLCAAGRRRRRSCRRSPARRGSAGGGRRTRRRSCRARRPRRSAPSGRRPSGAGPGRAAAPPPGVTRRCRRPGSPPRPRAGRSRSSRPCSRRAG